MKKKAKIEPSAFKKKREEVLAGWPTGKEARNLEESFAYMAKIPEDKRFSRSLSRADKSGQILLQPRAGVCLIGDHIRLLRTLQDEGTADLLPTTIDAYTRNNRYEEAQHGIKESQEAGRSLLNGFPAVNHGVTACREITEALDRPLQVRHGTPDARLLAEICLAGGFTAFEGGGISYNIPYAKDVPLARSIECWQYVDRLVGLYAENGFIINREPFGPLTGTLVPPCISNAIAILEALLAAEQGVKDLTLGYGQCGNLVQDAAAIASLRALARRTLDEHGFVDVQVSTVLHQWMGGFPVDEAKAYAVIAWGAAAAVISKVTKVITKSPHEAVGIPTAEANSCGLKTTRQIVNMLQHQNFGAMSLVEEEVRIIGEETADLISSVMKLGEGDLASGVVRAFKAGVLDVPFAPSRNAAGLVMPARDLNGAVRILEFGNLPIRPEIRAFHRRKLDERSREEKRPVSFQMVTDDIYAISKGFLVGKPK